MNAREMHRYLNSATPAVRDRVTKAGAWGYLWALSAPEFHGRGYSRDMVSAMATASMLAACELQRIVEVHGALQRKE